MGIFSFKCVEDPLMKMIRETYKASPLFVPDSKFLPLQVLAAKSNKVKSMRGELANYLVNGDTFEIKLDNATVANAEMDSTSTIDISAGITLLSNFFEALDIKDAKAKLKTAFKRVKKVTIKIEDSRRRFVDIGALGKALKKNKADKENPAMDIFLRAKDTHDMLIVSSVYQSKRMSMTIDVDGEAGVEVDVPLLKSWLKDGKVKVDNKWDHSKTIAFEGTRYLTFAFSCLRAQIQRDGGFKFGTEVNPEMKESHASSTSQSTSKPDAFIPLDNGNYQIFSEEAPVEIEGAGLLELEE